ncbi:MAG: hypothetical protein WC662_04455 [Candidatus Paceibacterota bacterium]|jgi:hypothetical protein
MKKNLKQFNPNNLVKMYDFYTKNRKKDEKNPTGNTKECIFKAKYISERGRGDDMMKVIIPIKGKISLELIQEDKGAELSFTNGNGAKVTITCLRTSWKPDEFVKEGFENELWETKITTELEIISCSEVGDENSQFKRIPSQKLAEAWENGCRFNNMIIADFNQNYYCK